MSIVLADYGRETATLSDSKFQKRWWCCRVWVGAQSKTFYKSGIMRLLREDGKSVPVELKGEYVE